MSRAELSSVLREITQDLIYISETDSPLVTVSVTDEAPVIDIGGFKSKIYPNTVSDEVVFQGATSVASMWGSHGSNFWKWLTDPRNQDHNRWRQIMFFMEDNLRSMYHFKYDITGLDITGGMYEYFLVGKTKTYADLVLGFGYKTVET